MREEVKQHFILLMFIWKNRTNLFYIRKWCSLVTTKISLKINLHLCIQNRADVRNMSDFWANYL